MYKNLKYAMKQNRLTAADLAKTLGITVKAFRQKLWGDRKFTLDEGITLYVRHFADVNLLWLFEKDNSKKD